MMSDRKILSAIDLELLRAVEDQRLADNLAEEQKADALKTDLPLPMLLEELRRLGVPCEERRGNTLWMGYVKASKHSGKRADKRHTRKLYEQACKNLAARLVN